MSVGIGAYFLQHQLLKGASDSVTIIKNVGVDTNTVDTVTDNAVKLLETVDVQALRGAISGVVRLLGFGPEADALATGVVAVLIILMGVGYLAKPTTDSSVSASDKGKNTTNSGDGTNK